MSNYFKAADFVPKVKEEEFPKGQTYRAKFIESGPVGYKQGTYLLLEDAVPSLAMSLKGCPVIIGHSEILDDKDMLDKAVGYVSRVECYDDCKEWYADFVIFCPKTIKKIEEGDLPFVSCGYRADLAEGTRINGVDYAKRIVGGTMMHLALVKKPRYNGTEIYKNSEDDIMTTEGVLYNQKDKTMLLFKKNKVEIDSETLVNTARGEMTIEKLVNELEAADAKIAEQDAKIADLEAKVAEAEAPAEAAPAEAAPEAQPEPKVEPVVEPAKEEAPAETDAGLKQDLNNALTEDAKVRVIQVPNVKI